MRMAKRCGGTVSALVCRVSSLELPLVTVCQRPKSEEVCAMYMYLRDRPSPYKSTSVIGLAQE